MAPAAEPEGVGRPAAAGAEPPVVFTHVMKTAGTTFHHQLLDHLGSDAVWPTHRRQAAESEAAGRGALLYLLPQQLLEAPVDELRRARVIAGHHPAAMVDALSERLGEPLPSVTLVRDPVARAVSHLRQVARQQRRAPEDLYDDPAFHEPMFCDHQTKVFAATVDDLVSHPVGSEPERVRAAHPEVMQQVDEAMLSGADPDRLQALAEQLPPGWGVVRLRRMWMTPTAWWLPVDDDRTAAAAERLERFDVVGLTERYDAFAAAVEERFGWTLPPTAPKRRTKDPAPLPGDLLRRIEEDTAHDQVLYERARELAPA